MSSRYMGFHKLVWDDDDWRQQANCRGISKEEMNEIFFYLADDELDARKKLARAKTFCDRCPVREECLEFALTNNQTHGIWGGMNNNQRREIKQIRARELLRQEE